MQVKPKHIIAALAAAVAVTLGQIGSPGELGGCADSAPKAEPAPKKDAAALAAEAAEDAKIKDRIARTLDAADQGAAAEEAFRTTLDKLWEKSTSKERGFIVEWLRDESMGSNPNPAIPLRFSDYARADAQNIRAEAARPKAGNADAGLADQAVRADRLESSATTMAILAELIYAGDGERCADLPANYQPPEKLTLAQRTATELFLGKQDSSDRQAIIDGALALEELRAERPPNPIACGGGTAFVAATEWPQVRAAVRAQTDYYMILLPAAP